MRPKWNSNDMTVLNAMNEAEDNKNVTIGPKVKRTVSEDDQTYSQYVIGVPNKGDRHNAKVLGVNWDSESDYLYFDLSSIVDFANNLPPTKRSILKIAATIFDPYGFLSVFTINVKTLFQELFIEKIGWSEELQGSHRNRFLKLVADINSLHGIAVTRYLFNKDSPVKAV